MARIEVILLVMLSHSVGPSTFSGRIYAALAIVAIVNATLDRYFGRK